MRAFAEAWPDFPDRQQAVGELPWGHDAALLTKLEQVSNASPTLERLFRKAGPATSSCATSSSAWSNAKPSLGASSAGRAGHRLLSAAATAPGGCRGCNARSSSQKSGDDYSAPSLKR